MRELTYGLPNVGFDNIKPRRVQLGAEEVHWPPPCRRDRVSVLFERCALEEPDHKSATGLECATDLEERDSYHFGLVVNEGIPREYSANRIREGTEGLDCAEGEVQFGIVVPGVRDELGHCIHATSIEIVLGEEVRPVAPATTSINDLAFDAAGPRRDELKIGRVHSHHQPQRSM